MLILRIATLLLLASAVSAAPKSSMEFADALNDAQAIVSTQSNCQIFKASGESMGEFYGDNSLLIVKGFQNDVIRAGMLIAYRADSGDVIAHKVIAVTSEGVITQGTNNFKADRAPVQPDMIVGIIFGVLHTSGIPDTARLPVAHCKSL